MSYNCNYSVFFRLKEKESKENMKTIAWKNYWNFGLFTRSNPICNYYCSFYLTLSWKQPLCGIQLYNVCQNDWRLPKEIHLYGILSDRFLKHFDIFRNSYFSFFIWFCQLLVNFKRKDIAIIRPKYKMAKNSQTW